MNERPSGLGHCHVRLFSRPFPLDHVLYARQLEQIPSLPAPAISLSRFPPSSPLLRPLDDDDQLWLQPCDNSTPLVFSRSHSSLSYVLTIFLYNFLLSLYDRRSVDTRIRTFPTLSPHPLLGVVGPPLVFKVVLLLVEESVVSNISVFPSSFFCFCAHTPALSLPFDATGPLTTFVLRGTAAEAR